MTDTMSPEISLPDRPWQSFYTDGNGLLVTIQVYRRRFPRRGHRSAWKKGYSRRGQIRRGILADDRIGLLHDISAGVSRQPPQSCTKYPGDLIATPYILHYPDN
jgi:hypothetical protein